MFFSSLLLSQDNSLFCYTVSLSQVQVHNASQTRRATLDRQDTRNEEMGLTRWCKLYLRYVVVDLQLVLWGNVRYRGVEVERYDVAVILRKLSCKTRHSKVTQTSMDVSQTKVR